MLLKIQTAHPGFELCLLYPFLPMITVALQVLFSRSLSLALSLYIYILTMIIIQQMYV